MKTEKELIDKWKVVLEFESKKIDAVDPNRFADCAKQLEDTEVYLLEKKASDILSSSLVTHIRVKYTNPELSRIENFEGVDYIVSEVSVQRRFPKENGDVGGVPFDAEDVIIDWALPILEDPTTKNYNSWRVDTHVFCGGYCDGVYNHVPKYGRSWEDVKNGIAPKE